jgi:NDP-sugar pyrophosphorylase family protein
MGGGEAGVKAMILAAGRGSRLKPLTDDRPKPMLPVSGRPALEHTIAWLRHYGVCGIGINLCHCPQVVIEHFGDGSRFGVEIEYSVEEDALGTAGGAKGLGYFLDETFVLVYGDVLTDLALDALVDFHHSRPEPSWLTMALYHVPNPTACGLVDVRDDGRVRRFVEKPLPDQVFTDLANAGISVVEPRVLTHVPLGRPYDFGRHLLPDLLAAGCPLYGQPIAQDDYLIDFGTPETYNYVQSSWPTRRAQVFLGDLCRN